jgi:hypothetical protein
MKLLFEEFVQQLFGNQHSVGLAAGLAAGR